MHLSQISLALTRVYGSGGGFSPLSLFALGEQGAWYDPSDLSTMFQDSAGTTPVTADGQPVGKILDKSGRGNHATQATAAARPLYKTSGGLHWLQFDGVDDSLTTAVVTLNSVNKMGIFFGEKNNSAPSRGPAYQVNYTLPGSSHMFGNIAGDMLYFARSSNATISQANSVGSDATSAKKVVTVQIDMDGGNLHDCLSVRNNGVFSADGNSVLGGGTFDNGIISLGVEIANGWYLLGNIYSLIIRGAANTTQEVTDTETWVAAKTGVTLP